MAEEKTVYIVNRILLEKGYSVLYKDIKTEILSHPDYPSFKCIKDSFDRLNIESIFIKIGVDDLVNLKESFLTYVEDNGETVLCIACISDGQCQVVIDKNNIFYLPMPAFIKRWNGVCGILEKSEIRYKKKLNWDWLLWLPTLLILPIILLENLLYYYLALAGLCLGIISFLKDIGADNNYVDKFCNIGKNIDCESLIRSEKSKLFGIFRLTDCVIIYFTTILSSYMLIKHVALEFYILSVLTVPFIIYSIAVQFYEKKWCIICMLVNVVLTTHLILLYNVSYLYSINWVNIFVITLLGAFWSFIFGKTRMYIHDNIKVKDINIENLSFRRNYHLFISYFKNLEPIKIIPDDILLKIPHINYSDGKIVLIVILNPFCKSCRDMYNIIDRINNRHHLFKTVYFVPKTYSDDIKHIDALLSYLAIDLFNQRDELWKSMLFQQNISTNHYTDKYARGFSDGNIFNKDYLDMLHLIRDWCFNTNIERTPTILINNKIFPYFYHPSDIENFSEELMDFTLSN